MNKDEMQAMAEAINQERRDKSAHLRSQGIPAAIINKAQHWGWGRIEKDLGVKPPKGGK